jgi:hypothetical protein
MRRLAHALGALFAALFAATGFVVLVQLASAGSAAASCATTPGVSAHPFTGTVLAVANSGRTATVLTDDRRTVTVNGSAADSPDAVTSVDRYFLIGTRYEFHPSNDADPYRDNLCSATHPIEPPTSTTSAAALPVSAPHQRRGLAVTVGGAGLTILVGVGATVWLGRRRAEPAG